MIGNLMLMLVFGSLVGWLASSVVKMASPLKILLGAGVLGAFFGIAVAYVMDFGPYGLVGSSIVCIVGASLTIAGLESMGIFGKVAAATR